MENANQHSPKSLIRVFGIFVLFLLVSCSEDDQPKICEECSEDNLQSSFEEHRLFLQLYDYKKAWVTDDISGHEYFYKLCQEDDNVFDSTTTAGLKYGQFDGEIFSSCDSAEVPYINFTNYEKLTGCNQQIDTITNISFELKGDWIFSYTVVNDDKIEVPCELEKYGIHFTDGSAGYFLCSYEVDASTDSLMLSEGICLLYDDSRLRTEESKVFVGAVEGILQSGDLPTIIFYEIQNNFLILTGKENDKVVLFKNE